MLLFRDNMIIGLFNIFFYLFCFYFGDYGMFLFVVSFFLLVMLLFLYKVMLKFDKFVDFIFVNLYYVRCVIVEFEVINVEIMD